MIHPANAIVRAGRVGRGLAKGGVSLAGVDDGLLPCEGDTRCQLHRRGGGKMSIFVGKTNLGGRFWRRSGTHDPRQRATTSLKLGETHVNVA
jgi:hypothetical protein